MNWFLVRLAILECLFLEKTFCSGYVFLFEVYPCAAALGGQKTHRGLFPFRSKITKMQKKSETPFRTTKQVFGLLFL